MKDIKTSILFSALFKYNGALCNCIDYIKNTYCIKPGYAIYADEYVPTVTIFENKADNPKSISIIVDKGFIQYRIILYQFLAKVFLLIFSFL